MARRKKIDEGTLKKLPICERRRFIRHPISFPLDFEYIPKKILGRSNTLNLSQGGLLFSTTHRLAADKMIMLKLPIQDKLFKVKAKIMHVAPDAENPKLFNIGVSFYRYADAFKVKLVEQLYLIDEYRTLRSLQFAHEISLEEASREWIKRYSKRFDKLFWGKESKKQH
ncbi:MAG: PilZ domain-containing protein [Candidatus Omnitrophota bacterium]